MAVTFKPRKQQIHVPGFGVVQKEDFGKEHFAVLMKRAGGTQDKKDAFIKQHFEVASYGDQELFKNEEKPATQDDNITETEAKPEESEKPKTAKGKGKKQSENAA